MVQRAGSPAGDTVEGVMVRVDAGRPAANPGGARVRQASGDGTLTGGAVGVGSADPVGALLARAADLAAAVQIADVPRRDAGARAAQTLASVGGDARRAGVGARRRETFEGVIDAFVATAAPRLPRGQTTDLPGRARWPTVVRDDASLSCEPIVPSASASGSHLHLT